MSVKQTGTVKCFDSEKGFGFIGRADGKDLFVHFRSIAGDGYRSLSDGQNVEFTGVEGKKARRLKT